VPPRLFSVSGLISEKQPENGLLSAADLFSCPSVFALIYEKEAKNALENRSARIADKFIC